MQEDKQQRTRIHARHLREKLIARNNSRLFRLTLDSLTDEDLLEMYDAHHKMKVEHIRAERAGPRT